VSESRREKLPGTANYFSRRRRLSEAPAPGIQQLGTASRGTPLALQEVAMTEPSMRLLYWTPRVVCIAFAAFLAIFAADELGGPGELWPRILTLTVHLIPAAMVLAGLCFAWRREWIGAVLFPLLAVIYLTATRGQLDWSAFAVIVGPLLFIGILFGLDWRQRADTAASALDSRSAEQHHGAGRRHGGQ
jgi:hypothetical protein